MRIRNGFVSNSSSSSFVISKKRLTDNQIRMIKDHIDVANVLLRNNTYSENEGNEKVKLFDKLDKWTITEYPDILYCATTMDNFDLKEFLEVIGITYE